MGGPATGHVAKKVFWVSVGLTAALYAVPFLSPVAYPLMLLSTLVHELGHGLTAVVVGGEFHKFVMFADGSGVATTATSSDLSRALVSAGGLVGPAIAAAISFVCARRHRSARVFLVAVSIGLAVALVLVVRSGFAFAFVGTVAGLCALTAIAASPTVCQTVVAFLGVQLALSVFARGDYLFTAVALTGNGAQPSDVAHISDALFGPYWLWGGICALFSVAVLLLGARYMLRSKSS